MTFTVRFSGHKNIRSNHQKTIEITKEQNVTPSGDCIVGVGASAACADIPDDLRGALQNSRSHVLITFNVGKYEFAVHGRGHEGLVLSHKDDIVIRKSDFVCPRTMSVECDKASDMLPREMVRLLQDPDTVGTMTIQIAS